MCESPAQPPPSFLYIQCFSLSLRRQKPPKPQFFSIAPRIASHLISSHLPSLVLFVSSVSVQLCCPLLRNCNCNCNSNWYAPLTLTSLFISISISISISNSFIAHFNSIFFTPTSTPRYILVFMLFRFGCSLVWFSLLNGRLLDFLQFCEFTIHLFTLVWLYLHISDAMGWV